jgi:chromosomal replication initiation ATPase DnaA
VLSSTKLLQQKTISLSFEPQMNIKDYFVGQSNQEAYSWINNWPEWGAHSMGCLVGPKGSGKTHLSKIWAAEARLIKTDADLKQHDGSGSYLIEDLPSNIFAEEALFHFYNRVKSQNGYLLITSTTMPAQWHIKLADLASRLKILNVHKIDMPDDDLLKALLIKQFSDRNIQITAQVQEYIIARIERSFEAVSQCVEQLDKASIQFQRKITIPMIKDNLSLFATFSNTSSSLTATF